MNQPSPANPIKATTAEASSENDRFVFPMSYAQQRLWILNQLELGRSPAYTIPVALHLTGTLNFNALWRSLNEIVQRHEILRTTFAAEENELVQIVNQRPLVPLALVDLRDLPTAVRTGELQRLSEEMAQRPFDLTQGPLLRIMLLQLADEEHVLLLNMHHIITDAWSMGVFFQELSTLYEAYGQGKPSPLPDLPIQYADFTLWEQKRLQGERLQKQLAYWKNHLAGAPALLDLPTDRPRPAVQTSRGATLPFSLPHALSEALKTLAQQEGVTLFMSLLAAFKVLLHRYTGQDDILVGTPAAGRHRRELEGLIGFFVNTLVLRTDLSGNPSFRELLHRVRQVALAAYAHQDLPFEKLIEELQPTRSLSYTPLFQVMLAFQEPPEAEAHLAGLNVRPMPIACEDVKFDLTLSIGEESGSLSGVWEYNADLFDAASIDRLQRHFETLLATIVSNPDEPIAAIPLLSTADRHQLLEAWNDTVIDYGQTAVLHQLIEEQVKRTPDAVALIFADQSLSYRELNRRANQLAHALQKRGVGPEVLVGICMERSLEMVIGLLAILKAGGAYVPLDPAYPPTRLAFMLADAVVPVLLTQESLVERLPQHSAEVLSLDTSWPAIAEESAVNPDSHVVPDNLAYMIYTSGSTGRPKGAMNSHRGVCNRLLWMQETYQLTAADRVLQKTPFSFDVSVWEFFWPLLTGATLVIARPEGHKDNVYLVNTIIEQNITTMHFVPSMLQLFVEAQNLEACRSLKRVICSGEALPLALQDRFFERMEAELHNLYGPTEAAIDVTFFACERGSERASVPIGRPIANTQIYLLDPFMQPVPIGVAGELHIGGVGVARGYHRRPRLTAEKFIPDPFSDEPGARLYKTGDLARFLPDGNIEFLGRIDFQVKVRGFRIELGEIEAALNRHTAVRESVVLAREDVPGDKRLVAYLVYSQGQTPTTSALRRFLKEALPEYMVPSAFVPMDALPLTPNGKVNRRVLPSPEPERPDLDSSFVAPRSAVEETLVQTWSELIGVGRVGVHDNFFELGGDSLLATRLISRMRQLFAVEIPFRHLFRQPTVAGLALVVEDALQTSAGQSTIAAFSSDFEEVEL